MVRLTGSVLYVLIFKIFFKTMLYGIIRLWDQGIELEDLSVFECYMDLEHMQKGLIIS